MTSLHRYCARETVTITVSSSFISPPLIGTTRDAWVDALPLPGISIGPKLNCPSAGRAGTKIVGSTVVFGDWIGLDTTPSGGVTPASRQYAVFPQYDAAFARMHGDLAAAEDKQREALRILQASGNPFEIAVARFELAEFLVARGKRVEGRALLTQALPVLRQSVLPAQTDRKAAERMARSLGL